MEASKTWDGRISVINLFRDLLYDRYLTVGNEPKNSEEHKTFNEDTFIEILKQLYEMDSIKFPYNPRYNKPYYADSYLCKLYTLLGVDYKMFDYTTSKSLYYSSFNKEFEDMITSYKLPHNDKIYTLLDIDDYKDDGRSPSILIISISSVCTPLFANNEIKDDTVKKELTSMKEEITYNGVKYTLDSVYLTNANKTSCNHIIVGMTCKSKKYVYNGQPYMGNRNFPCQLMRHDWNIRKNIDFFLSFDRCILYPIPKENPSENRYNFSEGIRKCIYVRKNASRDTSSSKESDIAKYRQIQRDVAISDKQRETTRLEEARLRFQSDVEKVHQEIKEEAIPKKPNPSQLARLMTPLSRLISSLFPNKIEKEEERKHLSDERRETARLRQEEERREAIRLRQEKERREAIRLRQEEERKRLSDERKRLSDERRETARLRQEEQKKEEEEKRHYEEQMALIKEEERKRISEEQKQRKRISEERKQRKRHKQRKQHKRISEERKQRNILHKSAPQIDELVNIMSNFTLDDKKINKKRIRKSSSNSSSNSSPKVIKRRPLKRNRKSNSSGSARRPLKRIKE
jgi:hypothetical protein